MTSRLPLLVFAKAPVPGQVKTRLMPALTPQAAALVHERLVRRTLALARALPGVDARLCCAPQAAHPECQRWAAEFGIPSQSQRGVGLGERMHWALQRALRRAPGALLMGCDAPDLSLDWLAEARDALSVQDAVLGPALDGGYLLIGLTQPQPALFTGMPWGSDRVLEITRQRLRAAGLTWHELPPLADLDRPEDLARYPELGAEGETLGESPIHG